MPESVVSFQSLPSDYQRVIQTAEERYEIAISPLQELAGGWSGAIIYLVRVASAESGKVEHLILKLDRKRPKSSSDEVSRHRTVQRKSSLEFSSLHIPDLAYEPVEVENALAIFYTIAGQSLHNFRTLSNYKRQSSLTVLFSATNHYLLDEWNADLTFEQVDHPQHLLKRWLGFRLEPGQKIETFLREVCHLSPEIPGFIVQGNILPNPLYYARSTDAWGQVRSIDAVVGLQHGDLNTNNILAKFSRQGDKLEGYYLIDFALFKEKMPLLYDQRYLEMSYLILSIEQGAFSSAVDLINRFSENDILEADQIPIELAGTNAVIRASRIAFEDWVRENHPSLHDDLWGQYWLAGSASGMSYCHKVGLADEVRLAGLIYAAANLKRYFILFGIPMPTDASQLYAKDKTKGVLAAGGSLTFPDRKELNNLPASPTNFIGRKTEVAEVIGQLLQPEVRLVSLTGPGGTGKTRLGLEVGKTLLERFPDGVYFIDLAQINDPSLVATAIAHTIGIREGGGRPPLETLKDYLASRNMLLILDNFEQIIEAASDVSQLLSAAPGLKGLATSRIPLQLRWEREFAVSPLDIPPNLQQSLDDTLEYESIALFQQQARAVQPSFEITEENYAAVKEICRRLDGLPLAIEIAAARIRMLPPQAMLKRLDQSLKLLVGGAKDLPSRQQTLRRTIDWSYELLEPEVQSLFTHLGIFAGGFTLLAAEEVCNPSGQIDVFSGVETLLTSSLLRQVKSVSDEPRFDMLQTIRQYALEKAEEAGILAKLHWDHCGYFSGLAEGEMGAGIYGAQSVMWLQRFDEEYDNFRVALLWALNHEEGIPNAITLSTPLFWYWYRYGHLQEGRELSERVLEATIKLGDSPLHAFALIFRGYLAMWSGDLMDAVQSGREGVEICQRLRFDEGLSLAKLGYGTALINQGRDQEAYPQLVDAVELFDDLDQPWFKGTVLVHLANVSLGMNNTNQALQWLDTAMPYMKGSGDIWNMAFALSNYGEVARVQGDYEKAEKYYRQTEALYWQADARGDQARLVNVLGYIAQHKREFSKARSLFLEGLEDFQELGNQRGIAECLAGMAALAAEENQHKWAVYLLSAAESQLKAFGGAWWPADRVEIERAREGMQSVLGDEFNELWIQGQSMNVEEAIAYATIGW